MLNNLQKKKLDNDVNNKIILSLKKRNNKKKLDINRKF